MEEHDNADASALGLYRVIVGDFTELLSLRYHVVSCCRPFCPDPFTEKGATKL